MRPTPASSAVRSSSRLLLLPWSTRALAGTPAVEGDVQLAARGHVEQQALLVGEAGHGQAEERLGGVDDVAAAERGGGLPGPGAEVVLVVDEERRAVLGGEVEEVEAADREVARAVDGRRVGQEGEGDRAGHQVRWYRRGGRGSVAPRLGGKADRLGSPGPALVAQGIEHRPPEPCAQVRILPRAQHERC